MAGAVCLGVSLVNIIKKPKRSVKKRLAIQSLQVAIAKEEGAFFGDSINCPLKHHFADGCYVREIFIPKGTIVVGKIHKHSHPNFIVKGRVLVVTEAGRNYFEAPCFMISPASTKRVVYTLEDTIWVTVHVTKEKDLNKIEDEIIAKDFREIGLKDPMLDLIDLLKGDGKCLG